MIAVIPQLHLTYPHQWPKNGLKHTLVNDSCDTPASSNVPPSMIAMIPPINEPKKDRNIPPSMTAMQLSLLWETVQCQVNSCKTPSEGKNKPYHYFTKKLCLIKNEEKVKKALRVDRGLFTLQYKEPLTAAHDMQFQRYFRVPQNVRDLQTGIGESELLF